MITDANGEPLHSWRVLLLPYLNEKKLYAAYHWDEPWDGPRNRELLKKIPNVYRCPSHGHHGESAGETVTNYLALTGPDFMIQPWGVRSDRDDAWQTAQAIAVDVSHLSVPWTAPEDLDGSQFPGLFHEQAEFNHPGGTNFLALDGQSHFIVYDAQLETVSPDAVQKSDTD